MSRKRRKQRQRAAAVRPAASSPSASKPVSRAPRGPIDEQRPPAPWGSFPLVEVIVLVALVMLIAGFVLQGQRGGVLLGTGLLLGSLAGLELSIREHLAGYRSHTVLLAAAGAVLTLVLLAYVAGLSAALGLAVAAAVFGLLVLLLGRVFRDRTGRTFKFR